jgi:hypothetical protein
MLGPLIGPGSRFLDLLVIVDAPGFSSLWLHDAVRRVVYTPGAAVGEIALGQQSRPDLFWPVDILLRAGGNAVLSGHWRAFTLGHLLRIGDHLVFHFKLGALEASVQIFTAGGVRRTYPQPAAQYPGAVVFWGGELLPSFAV